MNLLDSINQIKFQRIQFMKCPGCGKGETSFYATAEGVHGCKACFIKTVEKQLKAADISEWRWERFAHALSAAGTMENRLTALVHFSRFQQMDKLPNLLVANLGFETDHPLSKLVRQKALDACFAFNDRDKILKYLLNLRTHTTWQQKANIALAVYCLAPTLPRVKSVVTRMAKDISPNVRSHVADMIRRDTKSWTKALFQKLSLDVNPLVREACLKKMKNRDTVRNTVRAVSNARTAPPKKPRTLTPIERNIMRHFNFPVPAKVYALYLGHIPDLLDPAQYDPEEIKELKQNTTPTQVHLLGAALGNQAIFASLIEKLPEQAVGMLYACVNETYGLELWMAEQKRIHAAGEEYLPKINETALYHRLKKDPGFFLFDFGTGWSGYRGAAGVEIAINRGVLPYVRKHLPKPAPPRLTPVTGVEKKAGHLHEDNQEIFKTLPMILGFISQNKIKYAKNSDKILASSLKKMAEVCKIKEFYADGDKETLGLRTRLMADFFSSKPAWSPSELDDLPGFIKTALADYFKFKGFKSHRSRGTFDYIKRQMKEYDSESHETRIRTHLKKILELLPDKAWISVGNLAAVGTHMELNLSPFPDRYEFEDLYIPMDGSASYIGRERVGLSRLYSFDTITLPLIRRMMFLFGALGMVDLAYSAPENPIYREYNKPYLSPFDGLKYVRLTEFGRYAIDRTQHFTAKVSIASGEIEVDANKTLLSIQGEDPVKRMVLGAVGEQINQSSYRVNFNSFLKECTTAADVKNKIAFFRQNIAERPPAVWERFFDDLLARINPIKPVPALSVFKVKPDRELLSLLTSDRLLKKYVMRAENHHMVVEKAHLSTVKKRLALFGYFVG